MSKIIESFDMIEEQFGNSNNVKRIPNASSIRDAVYSDPRAVSYSLTYDNGKLAGVRYFNNLIAVFSRNETGYSFLSDPLIISDNDDNPGRKIATAESDLAKASCSEQDFKYPSRAFCELMLTHAAEFGCTAELKRKLHSAFLYNSLMNGYDPAFYISEADEKTVTSGIIKNYIKLVFSDKRISKLVNNAKLGHKEKLEELKGDGKRHFLTAFLFVDR